MFLFPFIYFHFFFFDFRTRSLDGACKVVLHAHKTNRLKSLWFVKRSRRRHRHRVPRALPRLRGIRVYYYPRYYRASMSCLFFSRTASFRKTNCTHRRRHRTSLTFPRPVRFIVFWTAPITIAMSNSLCTGPGGREILKVSNPRVHVKFKHFRTESRSRPCYRWAIILPCNGFNNNICGYACAYRCYIMRSRQLVRFACRRTTFDKRLKPRPFKHYYRIRRLAYATE
jgi:hypothetical protein